jgi:hypothetical protein
MRLLYERIVKKMSVMFQILFRKMNNDQTIDPLFKQNRKMPTLFIHPTFRAKVSLSITINFTSANKQSDLAKRYFHR